MAITAHDLPDGIQWHEGMLLAPQHFQLLSQRQEGLVSYHASMLSPFHWGTRHLKLDPVLLGEGTFRVLELEAVLPDGLIVSSAGSESGALEADLRAHKDELAQSPLTVFLVVPKQSSGALSSRGEWARYRSVDGDSVRDQNTGEAEVRIPRLRPRIGLLIAETPPDKYISLPLGRVTYSNEAYSLADYVPPQLRVAVQSPVGELCVAVAKRLREKSNFLSERMRAPASATRVPQLLETKSLVQAMVSVLPPFEVLLASGRAHPFQLFVCMASLVGHVAALGRGLLPPVLEPYDHNDLLANFKQAKDFLFQVIDEGIQESYTVFPFFLKKGNFYIQFDEEWQGRSLVLGVRGKDGATDKEVYRWVEQSLIGSHSKIGSLRSKRIRGAAREAIEGDGDLVPSRGVSLFALTPDPEFIEMNEALFVVNLDDKDGRNRPVEILLYVRNRS